jgi:hypothetical protein
MVPERNSSMPADLRLILSDVDGVIAAADGSGTWDKAAVQEVADLIEETNAGLILVTGRAGSYINEGISDALGACARRKMPCPIETPWGNFHGYPWVLENGAVIFDPATIRSYPNPGIIGLESFHELCRVARRIVATHGGRVEPGKTVCLSVNPPPGIKTGLFRIVIEQELDALCPEWRDVAEVHNSESAVDITPIGISKRSAVEDVLHWLGLRQHETAGGDPKATAPALGIGDSQGDIGWLPLMARIGTPSNGRETVGQLPGCWISNLPEAQGTLDILAHFFPSLHRAT